MNISSRDSYDFDGLPPELAAEAQALNRKQQMANYLIQQGLQPAQGQMTGRFYVPPSPLQGLAGLAQMALGAYSTSKNDDARKDISGRSNKMLADAMQQYKEASGPRITEGPRPTAPVASPPPSMGPHAGLMPQPAQPPQQMELPGPGAPVSTPRPPEDQRDAMAELMMSPHPQAQRFGQFEAKNADFAEQRGLDREARSADSLQASQRAVQAGLISRQDADRLAGQTQKLHDDRMTADKEKDRNNAMKIAGGHDAAKITVAGTKADALSTKEAQKVEATQKGQENVQVLSAQLRDYYDQLNQSGGVTSTEKGAMNNIGAGIANTGVGQTVGGAFGTKNQSLRNSIAQQRPLLMQSIMKATGMTAKQMDSNVELKMWLSTATDPALGYEANIRALDMLEKLYGGGMDEANKADTPSPSEGMTPTVPAFHDTEKQKRYQEFKRLHKP